MKKFAIISVSNKDGIVALGQGLSEKGYSILATGNTAKVLMSNGIECTEISDLTGFPEIFSGRVKTLHPKIFGGILMRRDYEDDKQQAEANDISPIDVVCVNLYPFPEVVKRKDISLEEKIENIDIGGPSLIRAAAKNYKYVSVLTDPSQYDDFLNELNEGEIKEATKAKLAYEAFAHTSFYDTLIANYFETEFEQPKTHFRVNLPLLQSLRYGENPHQSANLYGEFDQYFESIHGKELSYN
ncbi:MAG: bifunctional phosphoribosylaminoimidazolecarboxamide formyltransferase/inosine monophosphate cyclohydrolase, partial [Ignavibacteria bacterium]